MSESTSQGIPLINVEPNYIEEAQKSLYRRREDVKNILKDVLTSPSEVDGRVISLEAELHTLNKSRLASFGHNYEKPEILYIDRVNALNSRDKINAELQQIHSTYDMATSGDAYFSLGNYAFVFVNSYPFPDINAYSSMLLLRHELGGHGGSIRKLRNTSTQKDRRLITEARIGGNFISKNRIRTGGVFDEGHHAIEDAIFQGKEKNLQEEDIFLRDFPTVDELLPDVGEQFLALEKETKNRHMIPMNQKLVFLNSDTFEVGSTKYSYEFEEALMRKIYSKDQNLYKMALDFIYGDKILTFAKRIDSIFGSGYFHSLMLASTSEDAHELLNKL